VYVQSVPYLVVCRHSGNRTGWHIEEQWCQLMYRMYVPLLTVDQYYNLHMVLYSILSMFVGLVRKPTGVASLYTNVPWKRTVCMYLLVVHKPTCAPALYNNVPRKRTVGRVYCHLVHKPTCASVLYDSVPRKELYDPPNSAVCTTELLWFVLQNSLETTGHSQPSILP
jgi:hypothetical protein